MIELNNVSLTSAHDRDRVRRYIEDNQDEGVRLRPEVEMKKALATGQAFFIETASALCGCSLIYKFQGNISTLFGHQ